MGFTINNISNSLVRGKKYVQIFFVIFYSVGFFGIRTPYFQKLFIGLIPFALLLSFIIILFFHQAAINKKSIAILLAICLLSYFIEVIGVNSQVIFGSYKYGNGLGVKILNTPLLIGINWALLVYCSASMTDKLPIHYILKIILASLLMLSYDIILEQIAPFMDMWHWKDNIVPFQNYVAWFIVAILFQSLVKWAGITIQNQVASTIFVCQALFFLLLIIFNVAK